MSAVIDEGQRAPVPEVSPPSRTGRGAVDVARAAAGGAVGAVGAYALVASELLPGALTLALVLLAGMLIPTSDSVSRRVSLLGTVVLGWTPSLWWFRWPVHVDHGGVLAAAVVGALAAWVALHGSSSLGALWPRLRAVDVVPLASGLVAWGLMTDWWAPRTPYQALDVLLRGYDNVAHFSMFEMLRREGVMADQLGPAADGTAWHYGPYPQGFHAVAATFADLVGARDGGGATALAAYTLGVAVLVVICVVVLSATLCSLPWLRRHPLPAIPVVGLVVAGYLVGPGGTTIADGFAPFWYACVLMAVGISLSPMCVRAVMPLQLAAMAGAVVGVAQAWAPLCLLLVPAFLAVLLPLRRARWRAPVHLWVLASGVTVLAVVGVGRPAALLLRSVGIDEVVAAVGGFSPPDPTRLLGITMIALVAAAAYPRWQRRVTAPRFGPSARRVSVLGLVVVAGVGSAGWLVAAQVSRTGRPDYYFFKYVLGVELGLVTVLALMGSVLLTSHRAVRGSRAGWVVAVASMVVLPFVVSPSPTEPQLLSSGREAGTVTFPRGTDRSVLARDLLAATAFARRTPGTEVLLALPPGSTDQASFPEAWMLSLTGTWTTRADRQAAPLIRNVQGEAEAAAVATAVLTRSEDVVVLVPPADVESVRARISDQRVAARVRTWTMPRGSGS